MKFKLPFRLSAIIFSATIFVISLHSSARAATAPTQLTTSGDVYAFKWSPRDDALFLLRNARPQTRNGSTLQSVGDFYRVGLTNHTLTQLAANANFPAPSPDGKSVAFVTLDADGESRLRLLDLESMQTRDLDAADWGISPQWTSEGIELAYKLNGSVIAIRPDNGQKRVLVPQGGSLNFSISPRSDTIVFPAADGLYFVVGGQNTRIFSSDANVRVQRDMVWSHDGGRVALVITQGEPDPELWLVDANGGKSRRLLRGKSEYFSGLGWSPDDSQIIVTRTPTGSSIASAADIWSVSTDASDARPLTQDSEEESLAAYSPDGKQIAFLRDSNLWVMQLETSNLPLRDPIPQSAPGEIPPAPPLVVAPRAPTAQLTPPRRFASCTTRITPAGMCQSDKLTRLILKPTSSVWCPPKCTRIGPRKR